MTVVYPRSDQSSTGGLDDLNGLLCVQRGLKSKSSRTRPRSLQDPLKETMGRIGMFGLKLGQEYLFPSLRRDRNTSTFLRT